MANNINLKKASDYRIGAGCYKWWATEEDAVFILNKLGLEDEDLSSLEKVTVNGEDLYCIYVGSSVSILGRLNWHINGINGNSHVSTLRKTIAAVYGYDLSENDKISSKLCEFYVSWEEIKGDVDKAEKGLIEKNYFRPLNIVYNSHPNAKKSKPILEKLRAEIKKS